MRTSTLHLRAVTKKQSPPYVPARLPTNMVESSCAVLLWNPDMAPPNGAWFARKEQALQHIILQLISEQGQEWV
jgi:hypothetical protein